MTQTTTQVEVWDHPGCRTGAVRLGYIKSSADPSGRFALDRNEYLSFQMSVEDPAYALIRHRRIVRYTVGASVGADDYFEARIRNVRVTRSGEGTIADVRATGIVEDLTDAGPVLYSSGGLSLGKFTFSGTPTQWIDNVILPHLQARGYTFIARGTVDYADILTRDVDHESATALMNWLAQETRGEWYLSRNAATNYLLNLMVTYGSTNPTAYLIEGQSIAQIEQESDDAPHGTSVYPKGNADTYSGKRAVDATWKIQSVAAGPVRVTLADWSGTSFVVAIGVDTQWVGKQLLALRTGRRYTVTNSFYASQELELSSVDQLQAGDQVMLVNPPVAALRYVHGSMQQGQIAAMRVTAISTNDLTVTNDVASGTDPVPTSVDLYGLSVLALTGAVNSACTTFNSATNDLTVSSSASFAVGMVGWIASTGTAGSYGSVGNRGWYVITAIPTGTTIRLAPYDQQARLNGIPNGAISGFFRGHTPRAGTTYVSAWNASTNVVTVQSAAALGVASGDTILLYFDADHQPMENLLVHSPAETYYPSSRVRTRSDDLLTKGEHQLFPHGDPAFRAWTSPSAPTFFSSGTRTDAASVGGIFGPYVRLGSNGIGLTYVRIPPTLQVAILYRFKTPSVGTWAGPGSYYIDIGLASSTQLSFADTATVRYKPPGGAATGIEVNPDTWVSGQILFRPTDQTGASSIRAGDTYRLAVGIGSTSFYLDYLGVVPCPDGGAIAEADFPEFDQGSLLWSRSNLWLRTNGYVPSVFDLTVADLQRMDPVGFANKPIGPSSIGASVRFVSPTLARDETLRVVAVTPSFRAYGETVVTLSTQLQTLSRLLGGSTT